MMNYTEKTQSKCETLHELLCEHVKKDDFTDFQQRNLDWLIGLNDISVSEDGYLTMNKRRVLVQYQDYLELQKIMVLIIIKINEELCLKYQQENFE